MHDLLDSCLSRMETAREHPWQPIPDDLGTLLSLENSTKPQGEAAVFDVLANQVMPYATGNTHPSFFGWVHGTGLPVSVGADIVASTMNSNCGGRDHGAIEVERAVLDWVLRLSGMPSSASAILTTGTSQATILALCCARVQQFGEEVRNTGIRDLPEVRVYVSRSTHSCIGKALEVLGHGADALHFVEADSNGRMDIEALKRAVELDRMTGHVPLAVVGTAGSVDTGVYDSLDSMADYCLSQNIWFHVDAAYGFWILLAEDSFRQLARGINRASSIACDFHKWMSIPYDCGACMIHDKQLHKRTFAARPSYLTSQEKGLAGGDLWFCDYGIELSRGSRSLKIWTAIKALGTDAFGQYITDNCRQASLMGELAVSSDVLELAHPVISNLCCFYVLFGDPDEIVARLQIEGKVVFSTTVINGERCIRAAIVNHRTTEADIRQAIHDVEVLVNEC